MARQELGRRLQEARERVGLSQSEVGRRIGAHLTTVSRWERGAPVKAEALAKLAALYGVTAGELLGESAETTKPAPVEAGGLSEFARGALYAARRMSATVTAILDDVMAQEEQSALTPLERRLLAGADALREAQRAEAEQQAASDAQEPRRRQAAAG